jgi:hypothetical protein
MTPDELSSRSGLPRGPEIVVGGRKYPSESVYNDYKDDLFYSHERWNRYRDIRRKALDEPEQAK